jgi:hypothetical protein
MVFQGVIDMQVPGPDGFLISPDDPLRAAHLRLDDYLFAEEQRGPSEALDVKIWRKLPKPVVAEQVEAVLRRLTWLDAHDAELENAHVSRKRLIALLRVLYTLKAPYSEPELRKLLDLTVGLLGRIAPYGPVELVGIYQASNDLTPELCASLRRFQAALREEMSSGQAAMQSLQQQLHMLLWMDEWEAIDGSKCWSDGVRLDFRTFQGERRAKWRALFKHLRGNAPVRMPAGWARDAEPLLNAVGRDDFRQQIYTWFTPFRSGEPLPLSVAGSHVIKGLIWFCSVAKDDALKECCLWLLDAKWKQKRNTEKVMTALEVFGISKEELIERKLIKPPQSSAPGWLVKMQQARVMTSAGRVLADADGDLLLVQGESHFYRLYNSTGRIERATDNAVLELNWPAIPDSMRFFLHRVCDSPHQLALRAHLLEHDSIYGKYFVCKTPTV